MRKRNVQIHIMLSENEAHELKCDASKCGLTLRAYILSLIQKRPVKEQPKIDFFEVLEALERIGNNINQIAVKANSLNYIDKKLYKEHYEELQKTVAELLRAAYS